MRDGTNGGIGLRSATVRALSRFSAGGITIATKKNEDTDELPSNDEDNRISIFTRDSL